MFDFFRNLGRSEEQKQQEALGAYLDNELAPDDRDLVDQELALNSDLREELTEMKLWQAQMQNLPTRRVPRNFTLDPALYGRPQRQSMSRAYPVLRTATALSAFLFVIALAANLYLGGVSNDLAPQQAAAPAMDAIAAAAVTRPAGLDEEEAAVEQATEGFVLEESGDVEADVVPVEVVGVEAVPPESAARDEMSVETEVAEGEELLSEKPQELLPSLDLELVEGTLQPLDRAEGEAASVEVEALPEAEMPAAEVVEEAPLAATVPQQVEPQAPPPAEEQSLMQPIVEDDAVPMTPFSVYSGLSPLVFGLGLLFIILTVLTLLARGRR